MKTVTVIIPTYNREKRIERTLRSVLSQDYRNIEIIVVDDGSTDATESVIEQIIKRNKDADKHIRYYRQDNQGACAARNHGMMLATGSYILFLDSDDLIKRTYLSTQVQAIESNGAQCSICDFECVDDEGKLIGHLIGQFNNNRHPHDFIRKFVSPSISTVLMRRNSISPGLQWNTQLSKIQDVDFMYKYFVSIETYSYVNKALFQYCLHECERISDSYLEGIPYAILRESFKSYLDNNTDIVTTDSAKLYAAYSRVLRKHQLKKFLVGLIPVPLKKLRKCLQSKKGNSAILNQHR